MPDSPNRRNLSTTRRTALSMMGAGSVLSLAGCLDLFDDDREGFTASLGAEPDDWDPSAINDATTNSCYGTMCYESLIDNNFALDEWMPALATDWEQISEEPTAYRFELREGVEFHNGDEFVAEDVAFSVDRMRPTVNAATVAPIEDVEVIDDHTVEVTWNGPYAPALVDIAAVPILPHDAEEDISLEPEEDDHNFDEGSVGTGPWELVTYQPEDRVELEAFDGYWHDEDNPWGTVTFQIIPEQVSQEEAMHAGELDMIDNPAPFDLDQWEGEDAEPVTGTAVGFDFVSFPVNQEPYTNEKFRRGMTRMIPRSDIAEAIFGGFATPLGGPISPGLGAFFDENLNQQLLDEYVGEDAELGEQLMEEALEEEGMLDEAPIEVEFITNVNRTRERWMEEIQARIGESEFIDADLEVRAFDDLVDFLINPEGAAASRDVVGIGWTGGSDPDGHVESLLHSGFHVPNGFNWNLYENPDVDELIELGQVTVPVDERRDVYHELSEVLAEDVPEAFMWTSDQIDVVDTTRVEGWEPYPNSSFRYWALYRPNVDVVAQPADG